MSADLRNPAEGKTIDPELTLETITERLRVVERCIVRSPGDAAEQVRELARLIGGLVNVDVVVRTAQREQLIKLVERVEVLERRGEQAP